MSIINEKLLEFCSDGLTFVFKSRVVTDGLRMCINFIDEQIRVVWLAVQYLIIKFMVSVKRLLSVTISEHNTKIPFHLS